MDNENKIQSRKKFIGVGISAAALLTAFRFFIPGKKTKKSGTVKMLTQDGKLVEVDIAALPTKKKKITNKEMQTWIKNNKVQ
ncbi:MAG TPA: hypothetical protein VIJ92_00345 [Ginsengibacter sp.]